MKVKVNLIPRKIKEVKAKNIFFLRNYKEVEYIHAYQQTGYTIEGKYLVARMKNCGQRLLDPEETVYALF
jgi:hypothetical protein